ncbi:MAG: amidophosphoribosyltransferase [Verrucomicrobiales bacterium]|jgi:amidophosphoribosyltransferase
MCGIVGVVTSGKIKASVQVYDALGVIQHRGQDAAGIATCDDRARLHAHKANGLVRDVFQEQNIQELLGNIGIGHCRYPTAGTSSCAEAQPFYVNSPYGIVLAHNGNLTNAPELTQRLFQEDLRHLNTESDSEVLLNIFAHELAKQRKLHLDVQDVFDAVKQVHLHCDGAYAVIGMVLGYGIFAFRDPYGIRPLIYGRRDGPDGPEWMVSSESVALTALGYEIIADVEPGEAIFIDYDGNFYKRQCAENPQLFPCIFEFVYLARPDSFMDTVSVYKARLRMGEKLAETVKRQMGEDHDIDVVIPIPDTSRTSALPIAHELGVKYREGFIKNRYVGRTFIMPGQAERRNSVRKKLSPIPLEFKDKNVLLVDDSIVRGNTSKQIVQMAREAGARKVYMASAAPPVRYPNVYGIDMPVPGELVAHNRTLDQIAFEIGVDRLIYQELADLQASVTEGNPHILGCEASCFDGKYVTKGVTSEHLSRVAEERQDKARV